jgi:hypothetical protein
MQYLQADQKKIKLLTNIQEDIPVELYGDEARIQ